MFSISKCLKESFEIFKNNILLMLFFIGISFLIIIGAGVFVAKIPKDPTNIAKFTEFIKSNQFFILIIILILSQFITVIYFHIFIKLAKKESISFSDLLPEALLPKTLKLTGLCFLIMIIFLIFMAICLFGFTFLINNFKNLIFLPVILPFLLFIPVIIFLCQYYFSAFSIIDGNLGIFESLKESSAITEGSRLKLFLLLIPYFILSIIPLVNIFFPVFSNIFYCVVYKELCVIHGIMDDSDADLA